MCHADAHVYACTQLGRSDSSLSPYTAVCQATQSIVYIVLVASIADRCTGDRPIYVCVCEVVREKLPIPGTNIYLMYISSRAAGYMSTLVVRLTSGGRAPPVQLVAVHVRVSVEGVESRQVLAATQSTLTYTFSWNRLNAYNQKVYGVATAISTTFHPFNTQHKALYY